MGLVAILLSFIAGQLTYFHLHNHALKEHFHNECSQSNQSAQIIDEDCDLCDFLNLQYENNIEPDFALSTDFIINNDELFIVEPYCIKPYKLYLNKAPPFSC